MDDTTEQTTVKPCCSTGGSRLPLGQFEPDLYGLRTYVIDHSVGHNNNRDKIDTIVLLSNVFGPDYIHTRLVADEWAEAGFKVVVPDLFVGDPLPIDYIKRNQDRWNSDTIVTSDDFEPWLSNHREAVVKPMLDKFVKGIRDDPRTGRIVSIGFCWGARYALLLAQDDAPTKIEVAVTYHASFVKIEDVEGISKVPIALIKGSADEIFTNEFLNHLEEELRPRLDNRLLVKNIKDAPHGFAVGNNDMTTLEKEWKEEAKACGMAFIQKWLNV